VGEKSKIISACVTPEEAIEHKDANILSPLLDLMERADVISGHNAKKYDIPELNARAVENHLHYPRGYKILDTLIEARQNHRFMSNRLDYLASVFGFRPKMAMSDADWLRITKGDEKALRKMVRYNRGDVRTGIGVLESLYGLNGKPIEYYMRTLPSEQKDRRNAK
jgi:DNA polymerase III epsilon subunit-like protein